MCAEGGRFSSPALPRCWGKTLDVGVRELVLRVEDLGRMDFWSQQNLEQVLCCADLSTRKERAFLIFQMSSSSHRPLPATSHTLWAHAGAQGHSHNVKKSGFQESS